MPIYLQNGSIVYTCEDFHQSLPKKSKVIVRGILDTYEPLPVFVVEYKGKLYIAKYWDLVITPDQVEKLFGDKEHEVLLIYKN